MMLDGGCLVFALAFNGQAYQLGGSVVGVVDEFDKAAGFRIAGDVLGIIDPACLLTGVLPPGQAAVCP